MPVFTLGPERSAALADTLLHAFREVHDLASRPPAEGTYERIADVLRGAQTAVAEAVTVPPTRSPGNETGISREGIRMTAENEIALLARLKVCLGLHLAKGEPLTMEPVRAFVSAAIAVRALLSTPNLNPGTEVGGMEHHAADPFPGA